MVQLSWSSGNPCKTKRNIGRETDRQTENSNVSPVLFKIQRQLLGP